MTDRSGRLVATASMTLVLPMAIPHLPDRGAEVQATSSKVAVGGAYPVMVAARRAGVEVIAASCLGTGPNSAVISYELSREGITGISSEIVGDVGMKMVLLEADGSITSIVVPGVEAELEFATLKRIQLRPTDFIYVTASDLGTYNYRTALVQWLATVPETVRVVLAIGPQISDVNPQWLAQIWSRVNVLTMNRRETNQLREVLGGESLTESLTQLLPADSLVVRRNSEHGCTVNIGPASDPILIPGFQSSPVDTSAVGDAHTGVMIASLIQGYSVVESLTRANAAGALMVSRRGSMNLPNRGEVDRKILAEGR
ncbi:MAG: PfkB family carbohydrate kinase [Actinomycetaceae bacterium]|nr:PfkB family carbohydrate kinase [Actinomycetaceae bacterium]